MKNLSLLLIIALLSYSAFGMFPFFMWSKKCFTSSIALEEKVTSSQALDHLKNIAETYRVKNIALVIDEGLTTQDLMSTNADMPYLKS